MSVRESFKSTLSFLNTDIKSHFNLPLILEGGMTGLDYIFVHCVFMQ